jgi:hypothetical protein
MLRTTKNKEVMSKEDGVGLYVTKDEHIPFGTRNISQRSSLRSQRLLGSGTCPSTKELMDCFSDTEKLRTTIGGCL